MKTADRVAVILCDGITTRQLDAVTSLCTVDATEMRTDLKLSLNAGQRAKLSRHKACA